MNDPMLAKMAQVLVKYSLDIQKGQFLLVSGHIETEPLIREVYREAIKAGAHVELKVGLPSISRIFFDNASEEQLKWISPSAKLIYEKADAFLSIWGSDNFRELATVPSSKIATRHKYSGKLSHKMMDRAATGKARWGCAHYPTPAGAQDANMSNEEFEQLIWKTCLLNEEDPVKAWLDVHDQQEKLINRLKDCESIRVTAANGTDLTVNLKGRKWENCDGRVNMPDGEVFTGPIENKTEGIVRFNITQCYAGREADDVELRFKKGEVVDIKAKRGEDFVREMLATDEGAKRIGEFAIGTNPGITTPCRNIFLDEKIAGTIHMALGHGIAQTGSKNKSSIHWDMILDMRPGGELSADGEVFYRDGKLLI